jgi:cyclopropane fatty-acyl-phospholipid synthase-like methyltransferase
MSQYDMWESKWKKLANYLSETEFAKKSFSFIKDKNFNSLLDLGCGDGKDTLFFAKNGFKVTAIDFSKTAIDHLKGRINQEKIEDITPLIMNLEELDFNKKFDVIYANLTLQYFNDEITTKIFNDLHNLLNKGGFLFVKCKSSEDLLYGQGEKLEEDYFLLNDEKRHFFSENYLKEKLSQFKILRIRKTSSNHSVIDGPTIHASFIEAVATN